MRVLFLDDSQERHEKFKTLSIGHVVDHVYTAEEAIGALAANEYDLVCLDHDLGGHVFVDSNDPEATGYTVAKAIAGSERKPPRAIVHSFNRDGAQRMAQKLADAGVHTVKAPFGTWSLS